MSIDKIIVNILGIFLIFGTYWFFFMKKEEKTEVSDNPLITVNGGYHPSVIQIPFGKTTTVTFLRTDPSSCLEEVVLSEFNIKKYLPFNTQVMISLTPKIRRTFQFSCGMNMFHGKVIVV